MTPGPKGHPAFHYKSAVAKKLADAAAISQDIGRTLRFITRLLNEPDVDLQDALFTAALITYRRCFNGGTRTILSKSDVTALVESAEEIHNYYMAMADKFAAHSINPFEQMKTGVFLIDNEFAGTGAFYMRTITVDQNGLAHWARLVHSISLKIANDAKSLQAEFEAEARNRPVEQIKRGGILQIKLSTDPSSPRTDDHT